MPSCGYEPYSRAVERREGLDSILEGLAGISRIPVTIERLSPLPSQSSIRVHTMCGGPCRTV